MTARTLLSALALSLLPALASAMCGHEQAAQSCAEGTAWDPVSKACVTRVTS